MWDFTFFTRGIEGRRDLTFETTEKVDGLLPSKINLFLSNHTYQQIMDGSIKWETYFLCQFSKHSHKVLPSHAVIITKYLKILFHTSR